MTPAYAIATFSSKSPRWYLAELHNSIPGAMPSDTMTRAEMVAGITAARERFWDDKQVEIRKRNAAEKLELAQAIDGGQNVFPPNRARRRAGKCGNRQARQMDAGLAASDLNAWLSTLPPVEPA